MATQIIVNIDSGNGLLPDGTKPLPVPILTNHQLSLVAFAWGQLLKKTQDISRYLSYQFENKKFKIVAASLKNQWINQSKTATISQTWSARTLDIILYLFQKL